MVSNVMTKTLIDYLSNPWEWPRESDLVCKIVNDMKLSLSNCRSRFYVGPGAAGANSIHDTSPVRTEIKIDGGQRYDIGVLRSDKNHISEFSKGAYGVRDVVLKVRSGDIQCLVEVKLYPGRYMPMRNGTQESGWVDDLLKLHLVRGLPRGNLRGLLFVDTNVLFDKMGSNNNDRPYSPKKFVSNSVPWPLCADTNIISFNYVYSGNKYKVTLTLVSQEEWPSNGLYLWALGVRCRNIGDDQARKEYPGVFQDQDVEACCWRVTIV